MHPAQALALKYRRSPTCLTEEADLALLRYQTFGPGSIEELLLLPLTLGGLCRSKLLAFQPRAREKHESSNRGVEQLAAFHVPLLAGRLRTWLLGKSYSCVIFPAFFGNTHRLSFENGSSSAP